jgi:hypothetical protein
MCLVQGTQISEVDEWAYTFKENMAVRIKQPQKYEKILS